MVNRKILIFSAVLYVAIIAFIIGEGCTGKINDGQDSVTNDTISDTISPIKVEKLVEISDTFNLKIYQPKFSTVDFVTEDIPSKNDSTVTFVTAAAFTAGTPKERIPGKIAGSTEALYLDMGGDGIIPGIGMNMVNLWILIFRCPDKPIG